MARVLWQGVAASSPSNAAIHCPHASADGGGVCQAASPPPASSSFCANYHATCDATGLGAPYSDCLVVANAMKEGIPGTTTAGDTLSCRVRICHALGSASSCDVRAPASDSIAPTLRPFTFVICSLCGLRRPITSASQ